MANVTYLLGAGASAECLPTYRDFTAKFQSFRGELYKCAPPNEKTLVKTIADGANFLYDELKIHKTPDLVAKKYFHSENDSKSDLLKSYLSLFIMYEQMRIGIDKEMTDKRYDALLASILIPKKQKIELLDNIKILTWNYDLQFEKAFTTYYKKNIINSQDVIQSFPKIAKNADQTFEINKFSILHLNGIAFQPVDDIELMPLERHYNTTESMINQICKIWTTIQNPPETTNNGIELLKFAWESINPDLSISKSNVTLQHSLEVADKTEILIVIGYSFPLFNRVIDLAILNSMHRLNKIYIQSPQAAYIKSFLKQASQLPETNIIDLGYHDPFYVPDLYLEDKINQLPVIA